MSKAHRNQKSQLFKADEASWVDEAEGLSALLDDDW